MKGHGDCKQMLAELSDYVDGEMSAALCAALEEHLRQCENCRIVVDTLRKTIELYQETQPGEEALPSAVRQRLFVRLNLDDFAGLPG